MLILIILLLLYLSVIYYFLKHKNKLEQLANKESILDRSSDDYHQKMDQRNDIDYQKGKKEFKKNHQEALKAEKFSECLIKTKDNYSWCYISTYIF